MSEIALHFENDLKRIEAVETKAANSNNLLNIIQNSNNNPLYRILQPVQAWIAADDLGKQQSLPGMHTI